MRFPHQSSEATRRSSRHRVRRLTWPLAAATFLVLAACDQGAARFAVPTEPVTDVTIPTTTTIAGDSTTTLAPPTTLLDPAPGPWVPVTGNLAGLASECGNMSLISARPDRDDLIVGIAKQGLWVSQNGSPTWTRLGQGPGSDTITNRTSAIVYDPSHPETFWESGIYNGGAVYRTDNGGQTFHQLGSVPTSNGVSVDLTDPARRTLLSGTHEMPKVYRSSDGGATWTDVSAGLPPGVGFASQPHVVNATTLLIGTNNGAAAGVFRSTDAGATWTRVYTGGIQNEPLVSKVEPGALFWATDPYGGIIKSTDGGATWTKAAREGAINPYVSSLLEMPDGSLAAVGSRTIVVSADRGASWRTVGPALPFVPSDFVYSPFRKAFYIMHFNCDLAAGNNPVPPDGIMRLDFDPTKQAPAQP